MPIFIIIILPYIVIVLQFISTVTSTSPGYTTPFFLSSLWIVKGVSCYRRELFSHHQSAWYSSWAQGTHRATPSFLCYKVEVALVASGSISTLTRQNNIEGEIGKGSTHTKSLQVSLELYVIIMLYR